MGINPPNIVHDHRVLLLTLMTQNIINRTTKNVANPMIYSKKEELLMNFDKTKCTFFCKMAYLDC